MNYENIVVETHGPVGLIRLNRPQALNALIIAADRGPQRGSGAPSRPTGVGAIVITGSEKAFAAGADIKEMQEKTFMDAFLEDFITSWEDVSQCASRSSPRSRASRSAAAANWR